MTRAEKVAMAGGGMIAVLLASVWLLGIPLFLVAVVGACLAVDRRRERHARSAGVLLSFDSARERKHRGAA